MPNKIFKAFHFVLAIFVSHATYKEVRTILFNKCFTAMSLPAGLPDDASISFKQFFLRGSFTNHSMLTVLMPVLIAALSFFFDFFPESYTCSL